jgi:hypothetical protein
MYYGMSSDALKKLYVSGSLANHEDGFVFSIKNLVDSGSVSGITKLTVDDEERSLNGATVELGGKVRAVGSLSWSASLYIPYGAVLKVYVPGELSPGEHTIRMTINVPELGQLTLPITDTI